jgi:hypothetical protein
MRGPGSSARAMRPPATPATFFGLTERPPSKPGSPTRPCGGPLRNSAANCTASERGMPSAGAFWPVEPSAARATWMPLRRASICARCASSASFARRSSCWMASAGTDAAAGGGSAAARASTSRRAASSGIPVMRASASARKRRCMASMAADRALARAARASGDEPSRPGSGAGDSPAVSARRCRISRMCATRCSNWRASVRAIWPAVSRAAAATDITRSVSPKPARFISTKATTPCSAIEPVR